jgi:hypothetical protein
MMRYPVVKLSRYVVAGIAAVFTMASIYGLSKIVHNVKKGDKKGARKIKVK